VQVEGNADFATELSFVFRHLGWDFEEDLAHVFGDIAAHRMMQSTRKLLHGTTDSAARFSANLSEYAAHELNLLVSSTEFNHFRANIAELSAQLARFDLKIARYAANRL
jgi:ubiquinone biosynthesis protein UbiJ